MTKKILSVFMSLCHRRVVRDRGIYGDALVRYQVLQPENVTDITTSSLFISETGLVSFVDRQFNAELTVNVLHTGIPHFDLHYVIELVNVTGMLVSFPLDRNAGIM